jgi:CheY-like chemotaxis protein
MTNTRFLLVEDDSISCMMTTMAIETAVPDASVKVINDSVEALDFIKRNDDPNPAVMLLDINMPKMNGWQFLDEFQKLDDATKSRYRIYMLTSSADSKDREMASKYSFLKGYLLKPLNASDFQKAVAN